MEPITEDEIHVSLRRTALDELAQGAGIECLKRRLDATLTRLSSLHPDTRTSSGRLIRTREVSVCVADAGRSVSLRVSLRGESKRMFCDRPDTNT